MGMSTTHYIDAAGDYIGGFGDGAVPPDGSTEVTAPADGRDIWNGHAWVPYVAVKKPAPDLPAAIQALIDGDLVAAQVAMNKVK